MRPLGSWRSIIKFGLFWCPEIVVFGPAPISRKGEGGTSWNEFYDTRGGLDLDALLANDLHKPSPLDGKCYNLYGRTPGDGGLRPLGPSNISSLPLAKNSFTESRT